MHHAAAVRVREHLGNLSHVIESPREREELGVSLEERAQRAVRQQLHANEELSAALADFVDRHGVGMRESRGARDASEPLAEPAVPCELGVYELDGGEPPARMACAEHGPDRACPDLRLEEVVGDDAVDEADHQLISST